MRRLIPVAAGAAGLLLAGLAVAALAHSALAQDSYSYRAALTPGLEVPRAKAPANARGLFTGTVTEGGANRSLRWTLTFSNLSGKAVAAHVHKGRPGVAGGVLVPLCGPCKPGQSGSVPIPKEAADALKQGRAYVNVHTARNQAGEIRGQAKLTGKTAGPGAGSGDTTSSSTTPTTTDPYDGY